MFITPLVVISSIFPNYLFPQANVKNTKNCGKGYSFSFLKGERRLKTSAILFQKADLVKEHTICPYSANTKTKRFSTNCYTAPP